MTPNELRQTCLTLLAAQSNLQVWNGAPAESEPALGFGAGSLDVALDPDGRAHLYAALYVGSGWRTPEDDRLAGVSGTRVSTFQVTAAGGDIDRCLRAADKVLAALDGVLIASGGVIRNDIDPGLPREDRDPKPSRYYLPLIFRVAIS
ncbi:hypothetical protein [Phycicoccus avicenniae]|uniref:hypothetical protein n=1 Tax=Phycicoccus avicenniae TaxID=2828860 RepID=UPI003D2E5863